MFTMGDRYGNVTINGVQLIKDLKVVELKRELEQRGLNKYGNKKELVQRLAIFEESRQKSLSAKAKQETPNQWIEEDSNLANDFIRDYFRSQKALFQEHRSKLGESGVSESPAKLLVPNVEKPAAVHVPAKNDATTSQLTRQTQITAFDGHPEKSKGVKLTIKKHTDNVESSIPSSEVPRITRPSDLTEVEQTAPPVAHHRSRRKRPVYIDPPSPPLDNDSLEETIVKSPHRECTDAIVTPKVASLKIKLSESVEKKPFLGVKVSKSSDSLDAHLLNKINDPSCMSPQNAEISSSVSESSPKPSRDSPKSQDLRTSVPGPSKITEQKTSALPADLKSKDVPKILFSKHIEKPSDSRVRNLSRQKGPLKKVKKKVGRRPPISTLDSDDEILKRGFEEPVPKPLQSGVFIPQLPPTSIQSKISKKQSVSKPTRKSSRVAVPVIKHDIVQNNQGQSLSETENKIEPKSDAMLQILKQQIALPLHVEKFPAEKNEVSSTSELLESNMVPMVRLERLQSHLTDISHDAPVIDYMMVENAMEKEIIPDSRSDVMQPNFKNEQGSNQNAELNLDNKIEPIKSPPQRKNSYLIEDILEKPSDLIAQNKANESTSSISDSVMVETDPPSVAPKDKIQNFRMPDNCSKSVDVGHLELVKSFDDKVTPVNNNQLNEPSKNFLCSQVDVDEIANEAENIPKTQKNFEVDLSLTESIKIPSAMTLTDNTVLALVEKSPSLLMLDILGEAALAADIEDDVVIEKVAALNVKISKETEPQNLPKKDLISQSDIMEVTHLSSTEHLKLNVQSDENHSMDNLETVNQAISEKSSDLVTNAIVKDKLSHNVKSGLSPKTGLSVIQSTVITECMKTGNSEECMIKTKSDESIVVLGSQEFQFSEKNTGSIAEKHTELSKESMSTEAVQESILAKTSKESTPTETIKESTHVQAIKESTLAEAIKVTTTTEAIKVTTTTEAIKVTTATEVIKVSTPTEAIKESTVTKTTKVLTPIEAIREPAPAEKIKKSKANETVKKGIPQEVSKGCVILLKKSEESLISQGQSEKPISIEKSDESIASERSVKCILPEQSKETLFPKQSEDSISKEENTGSISGKGNAELASVKENKEPQSTKKIKVSVSRSEEYLSEAKVEMPQSIAEQESIKRIATDKSKEHVTTGKCTEHKDAEKSAEHEDTEKSTEHKGAEKSAEHKDADKSAEHKDAEKSAEHKDAEKSAEHKDAEKSAEHKDAEKSAEHKDAEKSAEHKDAEKSAEHIDAEKDTEEIYTDKSTAHVVMEKSGDHTVTDKSKQHIATKKGSQVTLPTSFSDPKGLNKHPILTKKVEDLVVSEEPEDVTIHKKSEKPKRSSCDIEECDKIFESAVPKNFVDKSFSSKLHHVEKSASVDCASTDVQNIRLPNSVNVETLPEESRDSIAESATKSLPSDATMGNRLEIESNRSKTEESSDLMKDVCCSEDGNEITKHSESVSVDNVGLVSGCNVPNRRILDIQMITSICSDVSRKNVLSKSASTAMQSLDETNVCKDSSIESSFKMLPSTVESKMGRKSNDSSDKNSTCISESNMTSIIPLLSSPIEPLSNSSDINSDESSSSMMGRRRKAQLETEETNGTKDIPGTPTHTMMTRRRSRSRSLEPEEAVRKSRKVEEETPVIDEDQKLDIILELNESVETFTDELSADSKSKVDESPAKLNESRKENTGRSDRERKSEKRGSPRRKSSRSSDSRKKSKRRSRSTSRKSTPSKRSKRSSTPQKEKTVEKEVVQKSPVQDTLEKPSIQEVKMTPMKDTVKKSPLKSKSAVKAEKVKLIEPADVIAEEVAKIEADVKEGSKENEKQLTPPCEEVVEPSKKSVDSSPFKSARTVSLNRAKVSGPPAKKRKWGTSTNGKQTIEISSESLKSLIPDVKPLTSDEVKLEADEEFSDTEKCDPNSHGPDKIAADVSSKDTSKSDDSRHMKRERIVYNSPPPKMEHRQIADEERQVRPKTKPSGGQTIVQPSRNPISNVIIVHNLVRPFTTKQLKDLLQRTGKLMENGFWIDNIKSKCIAMYENEDQSIETRIALHGVKWPNINPKNLVVDFSTEAELKKKLAETPHLNPIITEEPRLNKRKIEGPVREWDLAKMGERSPGEREREREKRRRDREEERGRKPEKVEEIVEPERAPTKPAKIKSIDCIFKKTKAQPAIYWLPLNAQQISEKEAQRRKKMAESAKVLAEMNAVEERQRVEREKERQKRREQERRRRTRSRSRRRSRSPKRSRRSSTRESRSRSSRRRSRSRS